MIQFLYNTIIGITYSNFFNDFIFYMLGNWSNIIKVLLNLFWQVLD